MPTSDEHTKPVDSTTGTSERLSVSSKSLSLPHHHDQRSSRSLRRLRDLSARGSLAAARLPFQFSRLQEIRNGEAQVQAAASSETLRLYKETRLEELRRRLEASQNRLRSVQETERNEMNTITYEEEAVMANVAAGTVPSTAVGLWGYDTTQGVKYFADFDNKVLRGPYTITTDDCDVLEQVEFVASEALKQADNLPYESEDQ